MRIRVAGFIELVVAFAGALAMRNVGNLVPSLAKAGYLEGRRLDDWNFVHIFGGFFCGLGLMGSLGLYVERVRKRSPPVWGLGRWTWSLMIPILLFPAFQHSVGVLLYREGVKELRGMIPFLIEESFRDYPRMQLAVLFAFVIASRVAGLPRDPAPDAREWAGRAYAFLLVAWWAYSGTIVR
jgi:hypothetical protein